MTQTCRPHRPLRGGAADTDDLFNAGFTRGRGDRCYRRGSLMLTIEGSWHTLHAAVNARDSTSGGPGQPGLWKIVGTADGGREQVFDLPRLADLAGDHASDDAWLDGNWGDEPAEDRHPTSPLRAMLEWAAATAGGRPPAGWQPPPPGTLCQWATPAALAIRVGGLVRQAEVITEPGRLALRCRITGVPPVLSAERRRWLDRLAGDANDRWRLVRVGLSGGESGTREDTRELVAEVDLTGCPPVCLEGVFRTALASLRWVVAWAVRSADFLADPACGSALLEAASSSGPSAGLAPA